MSGRLKKTCSCGHWIFLKKSTKSKVGQHANMEKGREDGGGETHYSNATAGEVSDRGRGEREKWRFIKKERNE